MAESSSTKKKHEAIQVLVRIRPFIETDNTDQTIVHVQDKTIVLDLPNNKKEKVFRFNSIYEEDAKTKEIYDNHCFNILDNITKGYNGCIISYGITNSGKTYTMSDDPNGGIIQNVFTDLFKLVNTMQENVVVQLSYFQIYQDNITDLLGKGVKRKLNIRGDDAKPWVEGLSFYKCTSPEDCLKLLEKGKKARITAETKLNLRSSRSHAILKLSVLAIEEAKVIHEGNLFLVDLAGSERLKKTEAIGLRKKEASKINLSMLALGNVITSLAANKSHIPYRDSKLTRILRNALGGNSITIFIANISPCSDSYEETLNVLRYAQRTKLINNTPVVNVDDKDVVIKSLRSEILKLNKEIEELKKLNEKHKDANRENERKYDADTSSSSDESIDIDENDLNADDRRKLKLRKELKLKIDDLAFNEEYLNQIYELINEPKKLKNIDPKVKVEVENKRKRAQEELIKVVRNENDYTQEEMDLLGIDVNGLKKVDINLFRKMCEFVKKQESIIAYQKQEINDLLEFSQQDRDVFKEIIEEQNDIPTTTVPIETSTATVNSSSIAVQTNKSSLCLIL